MRQSTPKLSAEHMAAIRCIHDDFSRSMVTKNFDAASLTYAENAVLMPPNHLAVRGRKAIKEWMATFPPILQFTVEIEGGEASDDLVYAHGSFLMVFQPEGAPEPVKEIGKYLEVRKKQPDGSWLLVADMFNSDK